jgi:hypothetical protein
MAWEYRVGLVDRLVRGGSSPLGRIEKGLETQGFLVTVQPSGFPRKVRLGGRRILLGGAV